MCFFSVKLQMFWLCILFHIWLKAVLAYATDWTWGSFEISFTRLNSLLPLGLLWIFFHQITFNSASYKVLSRAWKKYWTNVFKLGFIMQCRLILISLCRQGWPQTHRYSCYKLLSARIIDMYHHTWPYTFLHRMKHWIFSTKSEIYQRCYILPFIHHCIRQSRLRKCQ